MTQSAMTHFETQSPKAGFEQGRLANYKMELNLKQCNLKLIKKKHSRPKNQQDQGLFEEGMGLTGKNRRNLHYREERVSTGIRKIKVILKSARFLAKDTPRSPEAMLGVNPTLHGPTLVHFLFFVTNGRMDEQTHGQTDVLIEIVI